MSPISITFGTPTTKFQWFDSFKGLTDEELDEIAVHCRSSTAAIFTELSDRRNPWKDRTLEDYHNKLQEKWCGDAEQSVMHLYTKCRKWRTERRVLRRGLRRARIQWQRRPEKKWPAELLADKYAVGPLLEFLKDTEVGCREGGAERAAEWRQRRDQDGEDRLGNS